MPFKLAPNAPKRADFKGRGVIQLDNISEKLAQELAKEGCPYIILEEGKTIRSKPEKTIQVEKPQIEKPGLKEPKGDDKK